MRPTLRRAASLAALLVLGGCAGGPELAPSETFDWQGRAISFAPPPEGWRREGTDERHFTGVMFILTGSVGERISIGDHRLIAERDRRARLREVLERIDGAEPRKLAREISIARWRTEDPLSDRDAATIRDGNAALDRAYAAVFRDEPLTVRREIETALDIAGRWEIALEDVVERVKFRAEDRTIEGEWLVTSEGDTTIAGVPAYRVDYTWRTPERLYHGREFYFVADNHVFFAGFHGLERNLALFDRVAASITLPPGTPAVTEGVR